MDDPFGGGGGYRAPRAPQPPLQLVASTLATASDAWSRAPFPTPEALPSHCCGGDEAKRERLEQLVSEPGAALVRPTVCKSNRRLGRPRAAAAPRVLTRARRAAGAGGRAGG